jgi:hypothetical protein
MGLNIFERAAKKRLRFESGKGQLSAEDLFQLSLPTLNTLAKSVSKQLREEEEENFIPTAVSTSKKNIELQLKLDILKRVIEVKVMEDEARTTRAEKEAKRAKILELMATKTDEKLGSASMEELEQMLKEV